jgi:hypothetical protein
VAEGRRCAPRSRYETGAEDHHHHPLWHRGLMAQDHDGAARVRGSEPPTRHRPILSSSQAPPPCPYPRGNFFSKSSQPRNRRKSPRGRGSPKRNGRPDVRPSLEKPCTGNRGRLQNGKQHPTRRSERTPSFFRGNPPVWGVQHRFYMSEFRFIS